MQQAPTEFRGSLLKLYLDHVEGILPSPTDMDMFHTWMCRYCEETDSIFPLRSVRGLERRRIFETSDGTKIAPADNSPAWVTHAFLMHRRLRSYEEFRTMMHQMPTHMFDITKAIRGTANNAGWYVAHIVPAKNRDTNYLAWNREEVKRRFFLTVHPCNLFFVPGTLNRKLGEDPKVIRFIWNRYALRYGPLWNDFLQRVGIRQDADVLETDHGGMEVDCAVSAASAFKVRKTKPPEALVHAVAPKSSAPKSSDGVVQYRASRLTFKRDVIEALEEDGLFEVITPMGIYRFRKREFYATFPRIPLTNSYRQLGLYHGAKLHLKAERFRVSKPES